MPHEVAMIGSRGLPGQSGGVEHVLESICPRLVATEKANVRVYCASWVDHAGDDFRGVQLRRTRSVRTKHADTFTRSLLATIRELRGSSDVVHYHGIPSAPLALLPRLFGKKVVVTVHGLNWQCSKWRPAVRKLLKVGEWASAHFPHETIVVGKQLQEYYREHYAREVTYIPNGAEPLTARTSGLIEAAGLRPGRFVLYLGRLASEKGVHVLIEAFRRLPADTDLQLAIAGPSWFENGYEDELRRLAGDDRRICFLGEAGPELVQELYANCIAFVLPSETEGMSLALVEALAAGCCIITTSIPANADVLGDAGLTFPPGDVAGLQEHIARVAEEPGYAEDLRVRAAKRAADEFDWDRIAEAWAEVYDRLVERPG
jgi:glycosyltransferase involved in cell wall biosynthesis